MRRKTPKRKIKSDPKYKSINIAKLINYIMRKGKKAVAQKIVYNCFEVIKKETGKNPLDIFDLAIKNVAPEVQLKSRRIGGANYQIPVPVMGERKVALAFRWIIKAAQDRKGKPMKEKLALEIIDASNGIGAAVKKREDTYKMAEANRAFAHFARFRR